MQILLGFLFVSSVLCLLQGPTDWPDYGSGYQGGSWATYSAASTPSSIASPSHVVITGLVTATQWNTYAITSVVPYQLLPVYEYTFPVLGYPNAHVRLDIKTSGEIIFMGGVTAGPGWLSYASIVYPLSSTASYYSSMTLDSGWYNFGSPYSNAQYYYENGMVYLNGLITTPNSVTPNGAGALISSLSGIGPSTDLYYVIEANPDQAACLYITSGTGNIYLFAQSNPYSFTGWLSLSGILYVTISGSWQTLPLPSGWSWTNGNTDLYVIQGKMVVMTNTIYNYNSWSSYSSILFTLPSNAWPAQQQIFSGWNIPNSGFGGQVVRLDVSATGQVIVTAPFGTSGTLSFSNIHFLTK